jgi:diguanylate cyclase (GGDEF)-like protein/PAS domain S-box-containing protein
MSTKQLTYHQFKNIAETFGDQEIDPQEVANMSGITDMDYEVLNEYLLKWKAEKEKSKDKISKMLQGSSKGIETNEQRSLMALLRSTLESAKDGLLIVDENGKMVEWNDKFVEISRMPKEALETGLEGIGLDFMFTQLKHPERLIQDLMEIEKNNSLKGDAGEIEMLDGRVIERYTQPLLIDNKVCGRIWCFKDITQEKEGQKKINILTGAIQSCTQGIMILDGDSIVYTNEFLRNIMNAPDLQTVQNIQEHAKNNPGPFSIIWSAIEEGLAKGAKSSTISFSVKEKEGIEKVRWFEMSLFKSSYEEKNYNMCILNDITQSKSLQDELSYNAFHDILTGMPNRNCLVSEIKRKITAHQEFSVVFFDLDNFKMINDSLGHHIGDVLLKKLGARMSKMFEKEGLVGRLGGDEFLLVTQGVIKETDMDLMNSFVSQLCAPIKVRDYEFNLTFSVGISTFPEDGETPIELIKNADSAMYQKKNSGKNGIKFYDKKIKTKNMRKMAIANKIYKAIDNQELTLHYQPVYDLQAKRIASVEALLRWNNDALGGNVPPDEFIAVTEEIGFIDNITNWVFENALHQVRRWHDDVGPDLKLAMNLSGALLYNPKIIDNLHSIIASSNVASDKIVVEVTEGIFVNDSEAVSQALFKLRDLGLKIAIDDFGTGYSSLSYLQNLPIDIIKIDKTFTQRLAADAKVQSKAIILSVLSLGRHAGYDIVAEGVETLNQMQFLTEHHCQYGQGFFFSKPLPVRDIERLLHEDSLKSKN